MNHLPIPALSPEQGLRHYLQEIQKFPLLTAEEEFALARQWVKSGDISAAHRLVTSHLRLVAKIAMGYRGYGLPVGELIAEGNIGMMQAVKRFDPERGFRLTTYAVWWIRAAIQEYILRSWSLVKVGSSMAQKKLFFNLKKLRRKLSAVDDGDLSPENVEKIATSLDVSERDVIDMDRRMQAHDQHLNARVSHDSEDEWMDQLVDPSDSHELVLAESQERQINNTLLLEAMDKLNDREQHIIRERKLKDEPATLEDLSQHYNISRERVRQIETRAMEKLQKELIAAKQIKGLLPANLSS